MVVDQNSEQRFVPYDKVLGTTSFEFDQHVKELLPLREVLHERMQCDMRQHFADRCWLHENLRG